MPSGYEATIQCGRAPRRPTRAARSRSPPRLPTARPSPARSPTSRKPPRCEWSRPGSAPRRRRRSSSTRTGRRRSTPRPSRPRPAPSASFTYPLSTPVTVGETPVPAGYTATIRCGEGDRAAVHGRRHSRSLRPPSAASTITCTITNTQQLSTVRVVKQWVGAPSTTTIFVDADRGSALRRLDRRDRERRQRLLHLPDLDAGHRRRGRPGAGRLRGDDPVRHRRPPVAYTGGPFPVTSPAIDGATITCTIVEHPAALDRPSDQELVRHAEHRDDLRRPERGGALRRLDGRDRERGQRVLHVPGLDAGVRRRGRPCRPATPRRSSAAQALR